MSQNEPQTRAPVLSPSSAPYRVLVVEDDRAMRQSLAALLGAAGWQVEAVARAERAAPALTGFAADVVLSDMRMPGQSGLDLLRSLRADFDIPVVLISAHGDIAMAVEAMQEGAYSFVEKPYNTRRLLSILGHAAEQHRMQADNARLRARLMHLSGLDRVLIGQSPALQALRRDIAALAETRAAVLITGETGTGKDLVARALHDIGPLADRPFVAVNCALLSPERFGPEMFGAEGSGPGRIGQADGGTLFLDELCACPLDVQVGLLRVLEDGHVTPSGDGARARPVSIRVISATNEDVPKALAEGRLREDLFYRLNTFSLSLPPLRERRDDLPGLVTYFMSELAQIYEVTPPDLSPEDLRALLAHDWPGNVRELRSVAERRLLAARRGGGSVAEAISPDAEVEDLPETLRAAVASLERDLIARAIRAHAGRMDAAADALGIGRRTLNEKIVKLGLDKDQIL